MGLISSLFHALSKAEGNNVQGYKLGLFDLHIPGIKPVKTVFITIITFTQAVKDRFISFGYDDLYNLLQTGLSYFRD